MVLDYAARDKKRRRAEYEETQAAESAAKKVRKEREREAKEADKRRKALELAEKRIETRVANAALAVDAKRKTREERQEAFAQLEEDLKDAGLAGTPEARLRKQVLTAEHSLNKNTQVKGKYAQMSLDMMEDEADASERRERAARGEFSAGVRVA